MYKVEYKIYYANGSETELIMSGYSLSDLYARGCQMLTDITQSDNYMLMYWHGERCVDEDGFKYYGGFKRISFGPLLAKIYVRTSPNIGRIHNEPRRLEFVQFNLNVISDSDAEIMSSGIDQAVIRAAIVKEIKRLNMMRSVFDRTAAWTAVWSERRRHDRREVGSYGPWKRRRQQRRQCTCVMPPYARATSTGRCCRCGGLYG